MIHIQIGGSCSPRLCFRERCWMNSRKYGLLIVSSLSKYPNALRRSKIPNFKLGRFKNFPIFPNSNVPWLNSLKNTFPSGFLKSPFSLKNFWKNSYTTAYFGFYPDQTCQPFFSFWKVNNSFLESEARCSLWHLLCYVSTSNIANST